MKDKKAAVLSMLGILGWLLVLTLAGYQIIDYFKFKNAGKRFTAHHGQELCLRVQALETTPKPCEYE